MTTELTSLELSTTPATQTSIGSSTSTTSIRESKIGLDDEKLSPVIQPWEEWEEEEIEPIVLAELRTTMPDENFIRSCLVGQTELDFSECEMTSAMLVTLARVFPPLPTLHTLNFAFNEIGDEGVQVLATMLPRCFALRTLYLTGNEIGDKGAKALADVFPQLRELHELNLAANKIGDKGAEALADVFPQLRELHELNLADNKIGDKGAEALAAVWPRLRELYELNLVANKIGDKGVQALAKILCEVYSIKKLYLNDNPIGIEGLHFLVNELAFNGSLARLTLPEIGDPKYAKIIATAQKWLSRNAAFPLLSSSIATYIKQDLFSDLLQFLPLLPKVLVELVDGYLNKNITSEVFLTRLLSDSTKSEWQATDVLNQYQAVFNTEGNAKVVAAQIGELLAQHGLSNVTVITLADPSKNRFVVNIEITPEQIHTLVSSTYQLLPQKKLVESDSKAEQKSRLVSGGSSAALSITSFSSSSSSSSSTLTDSHTVGSMVGDSLSRAIGGGTKPDAKNKKNPSDPQPTSQNASDTDTGYHVG